MRSGWITGNSETGELDHRSDKIPLLKHRAPASIMHRDKLLSLREPAYAGCVQFQFAEPGLATVNLRHDHDSLSRRFAFPRFRNFPQGHLFNVDRQLSLASPRPNLLHRFT
jgi:hypothetical protein